MPPETSVSDLAGTAAWEAMSAEIGAAEQALALAPAGIARQPDYDRLLAAQRQATQAIHQWLSHALELETVSQPTRVFSLDVDGVLEEERAGFSATGLPGAAALKLLQLGRVAVLLNTARSVTEVRDRVSQFGLLGGVSAYGAAIWEAVYSRERGQLDDRAADELDRLRAVLRADSSLVLDPSYDCTVRASRIIEGAPGPIPGGAARRLLDEHRLSGLTFWVAPRHTDFVARACDKSSGLAQLRQDLGIVTLPLAAMGDAACDLPMLRPADVAFLPAATLPTYVAPRGQRLVRSRRLGDQALWEAACHLVPNLAQQRRVLAMVRGVKFPAWFPFALQKRPALGLGWFPRLATLYRLPRRR
jgi:3-deoxy-D-manno-octulosonate 8-phosphate phosphatase KdsC-like HAD superfamily phosphatase